MTRPALALVAATVLACVSYEELPLCGAVSARERPTLACRESDEAAAWQSLLAWEILRRSQWQYPYGVPLNVEVDDGGRVGRVCVGSAGQEAGWSTRDRVAASLPSLRSAPPAPACMSGTTVRLSRTLYEQGVPEGSEPPPLGMTPCEGPPEEFRHCPSERRVVCGVLRDRNRRSYPNACEACRDPDVIGWFDFHC